MLSSQLLIREFISWPGEAINKHANQQKQINLHLVNINSHPIHSILSLTVANLKTFYDNKSKSYNCTYYCLIISSCYNSVTVNYVPI